MKIINGNLLDRFDKAEFDAIAHVCNCQGVMGSGIAKVIKDRHPDAFKAYKDAERAMQKIPAYQGLQLGTISRGTATTGRSIYNLHAQNFYGTDKRHINYEALYCCLELVRDEMESRDEKTLGIPFKMGADRAGGDFRIVMAMVTSIFNQSDIWVTAVDLLGNHS